MKNKRDNNKILLYILSIFILLLIALLLIITKHSNYSYILLVLLFIDWILLLIYLNNTKSESKIYKSKIRYILKTFDSVLANLDSDLNLNKKDIIRIESFDDLINCQEEIKQPILYKIEDKSCAFILINKKTIFYTIIKENINIYNKVENSLIKAMNQKEEDTILDDIDKTMIIQTKNNKRYKVSPIREKKDDHNINVNKIKDVDSL